MTRSRLRALPGWALLSTLLFAPIASADMTKAQCIEADTQSQQLRRDEKLGAAKAQLKACTDPACPAMVRDDCAQRLDELDKLQPTLVFEVKDGQGRDMTEVKVILDGEPLADNVSGAAIPVDPGSHSFRFEAKGEKPVTKQLVLREGDKARHEKVQFGSGVVVVPPPANGSDGAGQRKAGVIVGVFGLIGLGLGGAFGALAGSEWSKAQKECATSASCTANENSLANGDRTNALTLATVSTIGFIAGGVLTAGGVVLFVTAPSGSSKEGKPAPAQGIQLVPTGGPGGGGLTLRGWF
jgi:hypothetical protein